MEIIGASILVSVITTKILATYYFKKVDGYVNVKRPIKGENSFCP